MNDDVDGNEPVRVRRTHVCVSHACDPISNNSIIKTRKQFLTFPFDMKPPAGAHRKEKISSEIIVETSGQGAPSALFISFHLQHNPSSHVAQ